MMNKDYNLADRLEDFAAGIILTYNTMPKSYAADYLAKQLIRSGFSTALNFGEAMGAGTTKDKVNKLRITLKELRECMRNLNIQKKTQLLQGKQLAKLSDENDQLIRIIVTIIKNNS